VHNGRARKGPLVKIDNRASLAALKERLARVEKGEVWGADHVGYYTDEEKAQEIARIKELIARIEAGNA
jgi:hypothetical protein